MILLLSLASGYNYCNNKTHRCIVKNREHFMCRLEKFPAYGGKTKFHEIVPDTSNFQEMVLDLLNSMRNRFASGELITSANKTFAKARRMRKLIWDKELGYLARSHASTVSFMRTECRSTQRFPHVGETPAVVIAKKEMDIKQICEKAFKTMFDEYLNVTDPFGLLHAFDAVRDYYVGHFTTIISDRASRVGCGVAVGSNCLATNQFCYFVTCYFDFNNIQSSYVYKSGDPGSSCDDWGVHGSDKYPFLCKNNGQIYPHDHGHKW